MQYKLKPMLGINQGFSPESNGVQNSSQFILKEETLIMSLWTLVMVSSNSCTQTQIKQSKHLANMIINMNMYLKRIDNAKIHENETQGKI